MSFAKSRRAVVSLMAKDRGTPDIRFQLLFRPVTDARFDTPSYGTRLGRGHLLHRLATARHERLEKLLDIPLDATLPARSFAICGLFLDAPVVRREGHGTPLELRTPCRGLNRSETCCARSGRD